MVFSSQSSGELVMFRKSSLAFAVAGLCLAATFTPADAQPFRSQWKTIPTAATSHLGQLVLTPIAAHIFCREFPRQCAVHRGRLPTDADGRVVLNQRTFHQLAHVQNRVNATIIPKNDRDQYGVPDRWMVGVRKGDCEDFALEKRRQLLNAGWPSSALVIGLGRDRWGQDHAVLVVRTTSGDFVLDNQQEGVVPIERSRSRVTSVQSPSNALQFARVRITNRQILAANY